jgi:hypothetical protein
VGPAATVPRGSNLLKLVKSIQNISNNFKNHSNFIRSKKDLLELGNFEIKCGFEEFDERNNFLHRNIFRFNLDFE